VVATAVTLDVDGFAVIDSLDPAGERYVDKRWRGPVMESLDGTLVVVTVRRAG
jgi:hypothetical protein